MIPGLVVYQQWLRVLVVVVLVRRHVSETRVSFEERLDPIVHLLQHQRVVHHVLRAAIISR
jgi:hypothetical protein